MSTQRTKKLKKKQVAAMLLSLALASNICYAEGVVLVNKDVLSDKNKRNTAIGLHSSVSGGIGNTASGELSSVSGGINNIASQVSASVSGGYQNEASGGNSSVSGGWKNTAEGDSSTISGGTKNTASGWYSSVSGGSENTASGHYSSVSGGGINQAIGDYSSVSGGHVGKAIGDYSWVAGGATAFGDMSVAIGNGAVNTYIGDVDTAEKSIAIGYQATADEANTISFGHDKGDISGYKEVSDGNYTLATYYNYALYNRLVKVADGIEDHDVATVGQLNKVSQSISSLETKINSSSGGSGNDSMAVHYDKDTPTITLGKTKEKPYVTLKVKSLDGYVSQRVYLDDNGHFINKPSISKAPYGYVYYIEGGVTKTFKDLDLDAVYTPGQVIETKAYFETNGKIDEDLETGGVTGDKSIVVSSDKLSGFELSEREGTNESLDKPVITYTDPTPIKIQNLADGEIKEGSKDAVNGGQLFTLRNMSVLYDSDIKDTITLGGSKGTKLTNLQDAVLSSSSTDAVTGRQLWMTNENMSGFSKKIDKNAESLKGLSTSVSNSLESVAAMSESISLMDNTKADSSLTNLSEAGKNVINEAATKAIQQYMKSLSVSGTPLQKEKAENNTSAQTGAVTNTTNPSTLSPAPPAMRKALLRSNSALQTSAITIDDLNAKADADTVYTKAETDAKLSSKANLSDMTARFANVDVQLSKKADVDSVYTKAETEEKVADSAMKTISYLEGYADQRDAELSGIFSQQLSQTKSELTRDINKVGAGAAALAALHPGEFDPENKLEFAAGYGHYKGSNASALGIYYHPNEDTLFNFAGTLGNGDPMLNAGVTFKLGPGSSPNTLSKTALTRELKSVKEANQALRIQNESLAQDVELLKKQLELLMKKQAAH